MYHIWWTSLCCKFTYYLNYSAENMILNTGVGRHQEVCDTSMTGTGESRPAFPLPKKWTLKKIHCSTIHLWASVINTELPWRKYSRLVERGYACWMNLDFIASLQPLFKRRKRQWIPSTHSIASLLFLLNYVLCILPSSLTICVKAFNRQIFHRTTALIFRISEFDLFCSNVISRRNICIL